MSFLPIKSLDWRVRKAARKGVASADELADVRAKIFALIGYPNFEVLSVARQN